MRFLSILVLTIAATTSLHAQNSRLDAEVDRRAAQVQGKVVAWHRDIHEHPELSNRETRTAELVAQHLRSLGLEVRTGVAHTGVIGVLRGGKPGPVVALRADMDALPVTEEGAPIGERGGAELMIEEGALENPKPSAIFGLHVFPYPAGELRYRPGGT